MAKLRSALGSLGRLGAIGGAATLALAAVLAGLAAALALAIILAFTSMLVSGVLGDHTNPGGGGLHAILTGAIARLRCSHRAANQTGKCGAEQKCIERSFHCEFPRFVGWRSRSAFCFWTEAPS